MSKFNTSGGIAGGLSGAASGAAIGSVVPGIGTAIGAGVGGLLGLFGGGLSGGRKKPKVKQLPLQTKEQQELLKLIQQGITTGEGPLGALLGEFNEEAFNKGVKEPQLKNFQENILPMLQEGFVARNSAGGSSHSKALNKAGVDLQSRLAELMYGAQNAHNQNRLTGLNSALNTRPFENAYQQGQPSAGQSFLTGISPGIGEGIGSWLADSLKSRSNQQQPQQQAPAFNVAPRAAQNAAYASQVG